MKKWFIGLNENIRKIIVVIFVAISFAVGYLGLHSNFCSWIWLLVSILTIILWRWNRKASPPKMFEFGEKRLTKMYQNAPSKIVESNEKDIEHAYKLIDFAANKYDEDNEFGYFIVLNGMGMARVGSNHNHRAVVDAVHLYQKDNPNRPVMEGYIKAICRSINSIGAPQGVDRIMDILNYELTIQKSGQASLPIDFEPIIIGLNALEETNEKEHLYDKSRKKQISDFKQSVEDFSKTQIVN